MADIFISYAREDREWVEKLARQLVSEGFTVWWDWDLLVGKRYRETIETELQTAKAAIVVWSQHSIRSDFVRDEAEDAQQRNILLPLLKEVVRPPAGFRQLQTADLSAWRGDGEHIEFRRMMKGVSSLVGRPSSGDTGAIPVDPAHPTLHFEQTEEAADAAPVSPVTPRIDSPPVARAPEPMPAVASPAPEPATPSPPVRAAPVPLLAAPHVSNPIIKYVAIGIVGLLAVIFIAVQLLSPSMRPAHPATTAPAGGVPLVAPGVPTPTPPAPTTTPPANPVTPPGAANTGGGDTEGPDEGQTGPHGTGTPPVNNPAPPANDGGTDDSGDTGQGNTH